MSQTVFLASEGAVSDAKNEHLESAFTPSQLLESFVNLEWLETKDASALKPLPQFGRKSAIRLSQLFSKFKPV
jgi:hypothetical protein